jgi:hypothetical protein
MGTLVEVMVGGKVGVTVTLAVGAIAEAVSVCWAKRVAALLFTRASTSTVGVVVVLAAAGEQPVTINKMASENIPNLCMFTPQAISVML